MSIQSKRVNAQIVKKSYPWIGISDLEIIVLFTSPSKGVVLHQDRCKLGGEYEIGHFGVNIVESQFTEYKGEITLSN